MLDVDIAEPVALVEIVRRLFDYTPPEFEEWTDAVTHFQNQVPELGRALAELIKDEEKSNPRFRAAFDDFLALCRQSINPNLKKRMRPPSRSGYFPKSPLAVEGGHKLRPRRRRAAVDLLIGLTVEPDELFLNWGGLVLVKLRFLVVALRLSTDGCGGGRFAVDMPGLELLSDGCA
ncbi:MAG: hypothetical protein QOH71_629 [Blastocatellia bacterium]|nr:hypothetical protein [Blastocatellia bacterium]